jgi:hypothetical protein
VTARDVAFMSWAVLDVASIVLLIVFEKRRK